MQPQSIEHLVTLPTPEAVAENYPYLLDDFYRDMMPAAMQMFLNLREDLSVDGLVLPISVEEVEHIHVAHDAAFVEQMNRLFARMFELKELSTQQMDILPDFVKRVLLVTLLQHIADSFMSYLLSKGRWEVELHSKEDLLEAPLFPELVGAFEPIVMVEYKRLKKERKAQAEKNLISIKGGKKRISIIDIHDQTHLNFRDLGILTDEKLPSFYRSLKDALFTVLHAYYAPTYVGGVLPDQRLEELHFYCRENVQFFLFHTLVDMENRQIFKNKRPPSQAV